MDEKGLITVYFRDYCNCGDPNCDFYEEYMIEFCGFLKKKQPWTVIICKYMHPVGYADLDETRYYKFNGKWYMRFSKKEFELVDSQAHIKNLDLFEDIFRNPDNHTFQFVAR